jgi:hypothetical protein
MHVLGSNFYVSSLHFKIIVRVFKSKTVFPLGVFVIVVRKTWDTHNVKVWKLYAINLSIPDTYHTQNRTEPWCRAPLSVGTPLIFFHIPHPTSSLNSKGLKEQAQQPSNNNRQRKRENTYCDRQQHELPEWDSRTG